MFVKFARNLMILSAIMLSGAPAALAQKGSNPGNATSIQVCNQSTDVASVAVHYRPLGQTTFYNEGWFRVYPGQCETVANTANDYFYLYAEVYGDSTRYWGGNFELCVDYPGPYAFWTPANNTCVGNQELRGFREFNYPSRGTYTWNLTR